LKKQRLLSILLVICLAVSMFSVTAGAIDVSNFKDVKESDWFYDYVKFVTSKGYFEGVSDTEFAPKDTMTRAMFVTVLARVEGVKVDNTKSAFSDVPANTWYTGAVTWAAQNKIVDGVADDKFAPNAAVTREQMCAIMERYITNCKKVVKGSAKVAAFNDVEEISDWAAKSVEYCRKLGLIDGFEDGSFRPTETSTRAQVAAVETRLCEVVVNEGSNPGPGPFIPDPTYTDYIFNAVDAAGQDSIALIREVLDSLANYTGITTLDTAVSVEDFAASAATNGGGSRPQSVTVNASLSSTLADEVISIATSYANRILGGTMSFNDVKTLVDNVIADIETEFGIDFDTDDRDAIVDAVYTYSLNKVTPIWDNFKGANGYYTGDITVTVPGAAPIVINVDDVNGVYYTGNTIAAATDIAVAIADQAFAHISDPAFYGNIDSNNDGWFEQINAAAEVILTFSAPANEYAEHTDYYNIYEYPFTFNMLLNGDGFVQYKYEGNISKVKFVISDEAQQDYDDAVAEAVSEALNDATVVSTVKEKVNEIIESYVDLTSGPLASMLPAEIGPSTRDTLETQISNAVKAWFTANSGLDLIGNADTGLEGSYFYEKFWNNNASAVRNDNALRNLELVLKSAIEVAIAQQVDDLYNQALAAVKSAAEGTTEFQDVVNSTVLTPTQKEEAKAAIYAAVAEEALKQSPFNLAAPVVNAATWENDFEVYARYVINFEVNAAAPTIADGQIVNAVADTIENHAYIALIEQATKIKKYDTMKDIVLGDLAYLLQNAEFQGIIASQGFGNYLVELADLCGDLPAGATLTFKQNGVVIANITSAQVAAIQSANTHVAVCNAIADLLNTTGLSALSLSTFEAGMDITAGYNGGEFTFGMVIAAE